MGRKRHGPGTIIGKLREAEVPMANGAKTTEAAEPIGVAERTCERWRRACGGPKVDQARRLKELGRENQRPRRAVSDLTPGKVIPAEAARGTEGPRQRNY